MANFDLHSSLLMAESNILYITQSPVGLQTLSGFVQCKRLFGTDCACGRGEGLRRCRKSQAQLEIHISGVPKCYLPALIDVAMRCQGNTSP
ncbi:hypothetical protein FKM82_008076 [Ascaphus truei]